MFPTNWSFARFADRKNDLVLSTNQNIEMQSKNDIQFPFNDKTSNVQMGENLILIDVKRQSITSLLHFGNFYHNHLCK